MKKLEKLFETDREIFEAIENERKRQNEGIELIASENFVSEAVLEACGSIMTNKYAEGYPDKRYYGGCSFVDVAEGIELIASENFVSEAVLEACGSIMTNKYAEGYPDKRYYGGCSFVDVAEKLAIERAKELFNVKYVNVQPHSGSQANMGVYKALINLGDVILGMKLDHGGHLTHGKNVNFSGKDYKVYSYSVSKETELIDYDEVERLAFEVKPKIIVAGASAYARVIDFKRFREIADKVGAYLMVDMAHYSRKKCKLFW